MTKAYLIGDIALEAPDDGFAPPWRLDVPIRYIRVVDRASDFAGLAGGIDALLADAADIATLAGYLESREIVALSDPDLGLARNGRVDAFEQHAPGLWMLGHLDEGAGGYLVLDVSAFQLGAVQVSAFQ